MTVISRFRVCTMAASQGLNASLQDGASRQHQAFALRLRNRVAELPRRFKPKVHGLVDLLQRRLLRVAVGRAARKLRRFGYIGAVFVAPIDDDLVLVHHAWDEEATIFSTAPLTDIKVA